MRLTVGPLADLGNWAGTISAVAQIRYCPLSTSEGGWRSGSGPSVDPARNSCQT